VTTVDVATGLVLIVKGAVVFPAATVTLAGTLAEALLLERVTCAPPPGAGPSSVTVLVEDCTPPRTVAGFTASEETIGRSGGVTVSDADLLAPP
jgi:hypothetical protein